MQCNIELMDTVASPLRWKGLILDPSLAVRRSVWNAVSRQIAANVAKLPEPVAQIRVQRLSDDVVRALSP